MMSKEEAKAIMYDLFSTGKEYEIEDGSDTYYLFVIHDNGFVRKGGEKSVVVPLSHLADMIKLNKITKDIYDEYNEESTVSVREIPHRYFREFIFTNKSGALVSLVQYSVKDGTYGRFTLHKSSFPNKSKVCIHWDLEKEKLYSKVTFMGVLNENAGLITSLYKELEEVEELVDYANDYIHNL